MYAWEICGLKMAEVGGTAHISYQGCKNLLCILCGCVCVVRFCVVMRNLWQVKMADEGEGLRTFYIRGVKISYAVYVVVRVQFAFCVRMGNLWPVKMGGYKQYFGPYFYSYSTSLKAVK